MVLQIEGSLCRFWASSWRAIK